MILPIFFLNYLYLANATPTNYRVSNNTFHKFIYKKDSPPTHVEELPQHKHKIKHDKTTMQFLTCYKSEKLKFYFQVFTYPKEFSGYCIYITLYEPQLF